MPVSEKIWKHMESHLEYDSHDMDTFRKNPINEDILSKATQIANKTFVFEVVESKGCNSKHKIGDRFYFDAAGNLLTKMNPKRCCIFVIQAMVPLIFAASEFIYAGADPNIIKFKHASCFDVGVNCGGWGQITVRFSTIDRV